MRARTHVVVATIAALAVGCPSERAPPAVVRENVAVTDDAPAPARLRETGNHLVGEPGPYLEQHAHNPVDWYPWGDEALAKAKRENKPIFLSIGYSTCHWCHVMERESFSDEAVAAFLNEHFVAIKVDREQRPDIDAIYLEAVGAMGGSTGWPLNVFLTPGGTPILGGTYWPREGDGKRPGFLDVAGEVQRAWAEHGETAAERGASVMKRLAEHAASGSATVDVALLDAAMAKLATARDDVRGGFGARQKFPQAPLLLAELRYAAGGDSPARTAAREHVVLTLEKMVHGGIYDRVGGSFHRYAVDPSWHVPHFEKTLYDNAQLAALYVEAGLRWDRPDFVEVGREVLNDLLAEWSVPGGGLIVGFDADDAGGEGAYYTWTREEIDAAFPPDQAVVVATAFDVDGRGDAALDGRSVLERRPNAEVASELATTADAVAGIVADARWVLSAKRRDRPEPARDDKILVGWNALAIAALADVGRWLDEPRFVDAANAGATFMRTRAIAAGVPQRGVWGGRVLGPAFLEDRALFGLALVRLHAATGETALLAEARTIADEIVAVHLDRTRGGFLRTPTTRADAALVPLLDMEDGPLPAGGTAATLLLLELATIGGDETMRNVALDVLARWSATARDEPTRAGTLLLALDLATANVHEVVVAGDDDDATDALWRELATTTSARVLPARVPAAGADASLASSFPALAGKTARAGKPTAYVCERGSCRLPTSDPAKLRDQLAKIERLTDRPSAR